MMEDWREKALEMLPELTESLNEAVSPSDAWRDIEDAFEEAYEEPVNQDLIRRVYGYAHWCLEFAKRGRYGPDDPPTCVLTIFYEEIPLCPAARNDMPNWFTLEDILFMHQTFSYLLSEQEFEDLKALFTEKRPAPKPAKKHKQKPRKPRGY